jgi:hypothetical protein
MNTQITEDTSMSREMEFTDLLSSFANNDKQVTNLKIKNDEKLQKKLCEHLCSQILKGEIGQESKDTQVREQDFGNTSL